jgi:hypothetical protein
MLAHHRAGDDRGTHGFGQCRTSAKKIFQSSLRLYLNESVQNKIRNYVDERRCIEKDWNGQPPLRFVRALRQFSGADALKIAV